MNQKSIIAYLVGIALCVPASVIADDSTVTIYGTLNGDLESVKAEGATGTGTNLPARNRLSSNASNVGFRGSEDLGGGLKAIFQVESSVAFDSAPAGNTFASRNSNVGLTGGFGTLFYGNWDTPFKIASSRLDPFGNTGIGGHSSIIGNSQITGPNAPAGNSFSFQRRQNNSVQYWTPNFSGLSSRLAYSANEERTATRNLRAPRIRADHVDQSAAQCLVRGRQSPDRQSHTSRGLHRGRRQHGQCHDSSRRRRGADSRQQRTDRRIAMDRRLRLPSLQTNRTVCPVQPRAERSRGSLRFLDQRDRHGHRRRPTGFGAGIKHTF